jgi:chromosome segregation ATPase
MQLWISGQLDKLVSDHGKLKADDEKLAEEIKTLEAAVDAHTKDDRNRREALQEQRNALSKQMEFLGHTIQEGQKTANDLYPNIETSLALAKHPERWEWKEAGTPSATIA